MPSSINWGVRGYISHHKYKYIGSRWPNGHHVFEILLYEDNIIHDSLNFFSGMYQEISGEFSNGARVRRPWMQQEIPQEFSNAVSRSAVSGESVNCQS